MKPTYLPGKSGLFIEVIRTYLRDEQVVFVDRWSLNTGGL